MTFLIIKSIDRIATDIKNTVLTTAATVLNRPTSPLTPRRKNAIAKLKKKKCKLEKDPRNSTFKKELSLARKEKFEANQSHI